MCIDTRTLCIELSQKKANIEGRSPPGTVPELKCDFSVAENTTHHERMLGYSMNGSWVNGFTKTTFHNAIGAAVPKTGAGVDRGDTGGPESPRGDQS